MDVSQNGWNIIDVLEGINKTLFSSLRELTDLEMAIKLKQVEKAVCKSKENFKDTHNITSVEVNKNNVQTFEPTSQNLLILKSNPNAENICTRQSIESSNETEVFKVEGSNISSEIKANCHSKDNLSTFDNSPSPLINIKTEQVNIASQSHIKNEITNEVVNKSRSMEDVVILSSDDEGVNKIDEQFQEEFIKCPRIRVSKNLHAAPIDSEITNEDTFSSLNESHVSSNDETVFEVYHDDFFSKKDVHQIKINFKESVNISEVEDILQHYCKLGSILDVTVKNNKALISFANNQSMQEALKIRNGHMGKVNILSIQQVSKPLEVSVGQGDNKRKANSKQNGKKKKKRLFLAN